MDTFELLTHAGLSKKDAAVYTTLLERGPLTLTEISTETHINRPALYTLLPKMQKDGLVSVIKNKKRLQYVAESPEKILRTYNDTHTEIAERLETLATEYVQHNPEKPLIKYFEGTHGLTFVFDDIANTLPRGGTFYRYSARTNRHDRAFENTHYARIRETKQLERLVITSEEKALLKKKKLNRLVKAIPKEFDLFEDNISLLIYGNKTAYIDYGAKTAFIVESEKIARFQEKLFKLLYKKLT